ncbi:MAG: hypothetical protein QF903_02245 [Planctomycetota bacterium]|nr:hypothetical protein [Planctomycetota bacterium]MDP6764006.1 hypothetical protein [Planctomycetota bacterium]MDP6988280.1 hypothetical protein [Planctomycetota bacterium]
MADHLTFAHHHLLREAVEQAGGTWTLTESYDVVRSGVPHPRALHAWRRAVPADRPRGGVDPRELQGRGRSAP